MARSGLEQRALGYAIQNIVPKHLDEVILTGLNRPDAYILAIVLVEEGVAATPVYLRRPFTQEPEFAAASVNLRLNELLARPAENS